MAVEVKITSRFAEISARMQQGISAVVRKTAFDAEASAKTNAPVRTGLLRNSIQTEIESPTVAWVFTNTEYAAFVEFGTRRMAAQPYLTPAMEQHRANFEAALKEIMKRG